MITVDPAIVRLASFSASGDKETRNSESDIPSKIVVETPDPRPNIVEGSAYTVKIPAITRVQEWSRAETGVGPSMASGNQSQESPITDLKSETKSKIEPIAVTGDESCENPTIPVPIAETHPARSTSPILLKPIAESDEEKVKERLNQVEIRQKDTIPTTSHDKINRNKLPEPLVPTTSQTVRRKDTKVRRNLTNVLSNSR